MSELFLVSGDLRFTAGGLERWLTSAAKVLRSLEARAEAHREISMQADTLRIRALLTNHALHDLETDLVDAFLGAPVHGGAGELLFVLDETPPLHARRLEVPGAGAVVTPGARAARALERHPGVRGLRAVLDAPVERGRPATRSGRGARPRSRSQSIVRCWSSTAPSSCRRCARAWRRTRALRSRRWGRS